LLIVFLYLLVVKQWLVGYVLNGVIIGFSFLIMFIQLFCFMHLNKESKPRWSLLTFLFMGLVLFVIVLGSLWIMENLNYHMNHD